MSSTLVPAPRPPGDLPAVWPETARRLAGYLSHLGCPEADRADVVQEVALRLVRRPMAFTGADDLLPWACTTGRNVYFDLSRERHRYPTENLDVLHDRTTAVDEVPRQAEARLALQAVLAAVLLLSEQQRQLLAESSGPRSPADRQARCRLLAMLIRSAGGLLVAVVLVAGAATWTPHHRHLAAAQRWVPVVPSHAAQAESSAASQGTDPLDAGTGRGTAAEGDHRVTAPRPRRRPTARRPAGVRVPVQNRGIQVGHQTPGR